MPRFKERTALINSACHNIIIDNIDNNSSKRQLRRSHWQKCQFNYTCFRGLNDGSKFAIDKQFYSSAEVSSSKLLKRGASYTPHTQNLAEPW